MLTRSHPVHSHIPHTTAGWKSSPVLPRPQIQASREYSEACVSKPQPVHMLGSQAVWNRAGPHQAAMAIQHLYSNLPTDLTVYLRDPCWLFLGTTIEEH